MVLFCVLWLPVFYLFWLTLRPAGSNSGELYALFVGGMAALARFFIPSIIDPYGFEICRYLSAFMDYTSLPVLFPMIAAKLIRRFYPRCGITDYIGFTLLALVPAALVSSIVWSANHDILRLVLTPLLWTALVLVFYPLIRLAANNTLGHKIVAIFGTVLYTLLIPFVWWAFFCQRTLIGTILLFPSFVPMIAVCAILLRKRHSKEIKAGFVQ
ncbi:MAG: hypothetical protein LBH18_01020 [Spirochaetaceae bacterium]|jgi:hypothetical protein|nr:hypothetical protein [Spirochaetaceae bacterium]